MVDFGCVKFGNMVGFGGGSDVWVGWSGVVVSD